MFSLRALVDKLEAHHLKYSPEITANLCHSCHHTVHFWPNRLTDNQKLKLLRLVFDEGKAWWVLDKTRDSPQDLARLIAPSRSKFVRSQQKIEVKRIQAAKPKKEIKRIKSVPEKHIKSAPEKKSK